MALSGPVPSGTGVAVGAGVAVGVGRAVGVGVGGGVAKLQAANTTRARSVQQKTRRMCFDRRDYTSRRC